VTAGCSGLMECGLWACGSETVDEEWELRWREMSEERRAHGTRKLTATSRLSTTTTTLSGASVGTEGQTTASL
jgi:hypothetical protein